MDTGKISYSLSADGSIFSCPANITFGSQNGSIAFCGVLRWSGRSLADTVTAAGGGLPSEIKSLVCALLPEHFPEQLSVYYGKGTLVLALQDSGIFFKLAKASGGTAFLFAFSPDGKPVNSADSDIVSTLKEIVRKTAGFFGIEQFLFYAKTGTAALLPRMTAGTGYMADLPRQLQACTVISCAGIDFDGDSIFCKGIRTLTGIHKTELYIGMAKGKSISIITLPQIKTGFMESSDLYILVEYNRTMSFVLRGKFLFPYLKDMEFTVDCGILQNAFRLEALAHPEKPVPLFGPFSLGDTCLMIQAGHALEFGMYTSLYIGSIQLFGAILLRQAGSAVQPILLSAAVSDLSIPLFMDNLLGTHIPGMEVLDFIKILGLPFQEMKNFDSEQIKNKDIPAIVSHFNTQVKSDALRLEESQVQLTSFGDGTDLADLKRMRHYFINNAGKLQLAAQFYYAVENTALGNYTIEKGIFVCGVIEIFGKRFEVLFSVRESDGLLAYAKIPSMNLGFLQIGSSEFQKETKQSLPVPKDSVLSQFVTPSQEGIVFFLSAGQKEVSFYFDGRVEILGIIRADARIIYMNRQISVDLSTDFLGLLRISLHLLVDYGSFSSGRFDFELSIDTSGLKEKLTAVTKKIDGAISKLRDKINNAQKEIDRAQSHVNELYRQINQFDEKIQQCRQAVHSAKWWKKAFVAIAKGIEIGAYEVAKAGVYAAIGVATAALQVAKGVVSLSGKIGEAVLKAVNQIIQGAMSLFYINFINLKASADVKQQYYQAEIDFVVLGKHYSLKKELKKQTFSSNPADALSGAINDHIESDINHIEDGAFRSSWRKYQYRQYTATENSRRLKHARKHLNASVELMKSMQDTYVEKLNIPLEECDEMNVSLLQALDCVENVLDTGAQAGNVSALGNAMGGLKRSVAAQEKKGICRSEEWDETKKLIARYNEARELYNQVLDSAKAVRKNRHDLLAHSEKIHQKAKEEKAVMTDSDSNMGEVITRVEEQMYEVFPVDRSGRDFINLSREVSLQKYFMETEKKLNIKTSKNIQNMRSMSRKGDYNNRL